MPKTIAGITMIYERDLAELMNAAAALGAIAVLVGLESNAAPPDVIAEVYKRIEPEIRPTSIRELVGGDLGVEVEVRKARDGSAFDNATRRGPPREASVPPCVHCGSDEHAGDDCDRGW